MFQRLSLTTKTALITLATFIVVIWSLAFFAGNVLREDTERLIGEQQFSALKLVADNADSAIRERIDALTIAASFYQEQTPIRPAEWQSMLLQRRVTANLFNRGLLVTDSKGIAVASVPESAGRIGIDYSNSPTVKSVLRDGVPKVGQPVIGRPTNSPVFAITVPIKDNAGNVIGTLTGGTDLLRPSFLDVVSQNKVGRTGGLLLIDRDTRRIITATDRSRIMETLPGPGIAPEIDPDFAGRQGTQKLRNKANVEVLSSVRKLSAADWIVVAYLPTEEMYGPIGATRWKLLSAALVLTAIAALLIWWVLRRQLAPALVTAKRIAALASTDGPVELLPVGRSDEIGNLVAGFNLLLMKLKNREDRLERAGGLAKVGGWEYYPKTEERFWSQQLLRILEIEPADVPATREGVWRFYEPKVVERMRETQKASIENGVPWDLEVPMVTGKGRQIWVRQRGSAEMVDGEVFRVVGTTQDITDRKLIQDELEREHDFALQVINSMGQGLSVTDADGKFTFVNPEYARIAGRTPEEMVGLRPHDITPAAFVETHDVQRDQRIQGLTTTYESGVMRPDGTIVPVAITGAPRYQDGKYLGSIAVISDLTEQKRMERLLEEQRDFATQILNNMGQGLGVTDAEGIFQYVNPAYAKLYGRTVDEMIGTNSENVLVPEERAEQKRQRELRREGLVTTYQTRIMRPDGRVVPVLITAAPRNIDGKYNGAIAVVTDLSERLTAERALLESEGRFRSLMENVESIAVQGYRLDGTVVFWNKASERFYGFTEQEAVGKNLVDLVIPLEMQNTVKADIAEMAATGVPIPPSELRLQRKDRSWISVYSSHALTKPEGRDPEFFCLDIDLTEREQAMAAREVLETKLRESQKMEAIGTLAGGIAHDFNNILATILGNVELARHSTFNDSQVSSNLDEIRKAGTRARDLVGQILSFSRRQPTTRKPLLLGPIVREAVRLVRAALPVNISLDFESAPGAAAVMGDSTQLQQVVINLATNAIHAIGDEAGQIRIRLDCVMSDAVSDTLPEHVLALAAGRAIPLVRLRVTDTGHGMEEATMSRLFEPFFTTKSVDEGTGLGLSVVHGIVRSHDGVIRVESQPGAGATFTILLPAAEASAMHEAPDSEKMTVAEVPLAARAKRVLYLDDDEALALLVTRMLERRGYKVAAFTDQRAAIDALKAHPDDYSLFVTDYNMPGMSGLDVAREVRAVRPDLPVAVVSGFVDEKLRALAAEAGVKELIFKANVVEDFCDAVQRLVLLH